MKVLALDVGSKTIGVAVSDELRMTAQGLKTIIWTEHDMSSADDELEAIIREHNVTEIVVGLPKNMDGSIGERGKLTQIYANRLRRRFQLPVHFVDERLSTVAAEQVLLEADLSRKKRSKVIDKMAATIILQQYLEQI
ncbi:MAG TPA: Holliday junction resolvase RuvX [Pseudogracilibacillus sp.]|nr:Holliday junction resolvase RuvX [Pseudogracilibacillus sp.]